MLYTFWIAKKDFPTVKFQEIRQEIKSWMTTQKYSSSDQ